MIFGKRRFLRVMCMALMLSPNLSWAMAGDGALLTNAVSATYHGVAGVSVQYTVSYAVSTTVLVSCPVVVLVKSIVAPDLGWPPAPAPADTVQNVGGTVTFSVCAINNSLQASAFGMTIRDRMPENTSWVPDGYGKWGAAFNEERYSINSGGSWPNLGGAGDPPALGTGTPVWFFWEIDALGPGASACATYSVKIL